MQTDFGLHRERWRVMRLAGAWPVEFDATFGLEQDGGAMLLTGFGVGVRVARDGAR